MDQNDLKLTLYNKCQIETKCNFKIIFYSSNSWSLFAARACRPSQRYDCQSITGGISAWFWHISFGWSRQEHINYRTGTKSALQIQMHTESSCQFLSGFEWILNMEFCLQNFWYFDKNCQWKLNLGLIFLHFEF